MKQFDNRGRKINYDAPGQLGAHSPRPQKLKKRARFAEQIDAMVDYWNGRGEAHRPLGVTLSQLKNLMHIPDEKRLKWQPTGDETYRDHPLFVVDEE
jgi:hypothetical protein